MSRSGSSSGATWPWPAAAGAAPTAGLAGSAPSAAQAGTLHARTVIRTRKLRLIAIIDSSVVRCAVGNPALDDQQLAVCQEGPVSSWHPHSGDVGLPLEFVDD